MARFGTQISHVPTFRIGGMGGWVVNSNKNSVRILGLCELLRRPRSSSVLLAPDDRGLGHPPPPRGASSGLVYSSMITESSHRHLK